MDNFCMVCGKVLDGADGVPRAGKAEVESLRARGLPIPENICAGCLPKKVSDLVMKRKNRMCSSLIILGVVLMVSSLFFSHPALYVMGCGGAFVALGVRLDLLRDQNEAILEMLSAMKKNTGE